MRAITRRDPEDLRARVGEIMAAPSGGRVSVKLVDGTVTVPILRGYSPTVGDQCLVLVRGRLAFVIGALGTAPPPPPAPDPADTPGDTSTTPKKPPPPDDPERGADVFRPIYTGSYRGGSWRSDTRDLFQGDWSGRGINTGAAFLGKGPRGLRGATATRVVVRYRRGAGGVYAATSPTFRLLAETSRPGGAPTEVAGDVGGAVKIGETRTWQLPTAWGQQMIDGTAGGIGISVPGTSPYLSLRGGVLTVRIEWKK